MTRIASTSGLLMAILFSSLAVLEEAKGQEASTQKPAIELGAPFADQMVLQQEMQVPIWGWSQPGSRITVEFAGQKKVTTTASDGRWMLTLDPLKASFDSAKMMIADSEGSSVTIKNILVGEVWLASGQSNMQWKVAKSKCSRLAREFSAEHEGKPAPIREFQVTSVTSQLHPIKKATGSWKHGDYQDYSAIAFAFAHEIYRELKVPIGILNCSFSQTSIQAWVPREGFASARDEIGKAIHLQCLQTDPSTPEHQKAWNEFYQSLNKQVLASQIAIRQGKTGKPISAPIPGNLNTNRDASWLFNGRMSPVVPFAIRGAIWNQGYANMNGGLSYYSHLHSLIRGWRQVWNRPDLPVYFHQFYSAGMRHAGKEINEPSISASAEMRLGTWLARDIPNSGMASQIDISGGIHYQHKAVPGQRLALHALKNQYNKQVIADGPMFQSYSVKGDRLIIEFDHAKGGLVVAGTAYHALGRHSDSSGYANPKIIPDGENQVKLFFVAGADRVWHPANCKIDGEKVVVWSPKVKNPRGVSYATGEVGFQPNLYNRALLPMTPFIFFDNKMVTSKTWPNAKLKIAGKKIDPGKVGKVYEYRKMPLLSVQFRNDAVFQADQPVMIWGSTRNYGEWQSAPEKGDCKVHFEFGDIKKTIAVTPEMAEWSVVLPPRKASNKPHTLRVHFTIDGEKVHERVVTGIVFGDVWCVVAPAGKFDLPKVKPSGQIVRMIENQSNRDGRAAPSRFSICVSRTPRVKEANGKWSNRLAAYWKDADGLAAVIGNHLAAKTGRPTGIIYLKARKDIPLKNWIAPDFLKDAPSLMADYKTVGSQYADNPYYLENVRRYISDWKTYWEQHIPVMMKTKSVPDGSSWGSFPSPKPNVGDSTATFEYNVYMHCFTPTALKGVVFLCGESMVSEDQGAYFGPEMSALANSCKSRFCFGHVERDIPFFYTMPAKSLAPKITSPVNIKGKSAAIEVSNWLHIEDVLKSIQP